MPASYDDLKSAFLALQRLATIDRTGWLNGLADENPALHQALESFLAFEATPTTDLSVHTTDDTGPGPLKGTRYEDRGLLGAGGIGAVRRVYDPSLDRVVALKMLRTGYALHTEAERRAAATRRFVTEAQIQASLAHPAILPVYERGTLPDGRPYLTMAEVTGDTLEFRIKAVHASASDRWRATPEGWTFVGLIEAFEQVCRGVAHAHSKGVLHRDLKPSNVMLEGESGAIVLDWGLALPRDSGRTSQIAGTPNYMAPEQVSPEAPLDERSDVYALGAILYAILGGVDPHGGASPAQAIARLRQKVAPEAPGRADGPEPPAALASLCLRALATDPSARPPTAALVADEVRTWLEAQSPRRGGWRRGAAVGAGIGIALVAAAALVAVGPSAQDSRERDAASRLAGLRTTVARHLENDDIDAAELAFDSFVALQENLGTAALAEAWMDRAALNEDLGRHLDARRHLGQAYAASPTKPLRARALTAIVAAQSEEGAWRDLAATLDILKARHPSAATSQEAGLAAWRLAVASRDFAAANTLAPSDLHGLERLLSPLSSATPLPGALGSTPRWFVDWEGELAMATPQGLMTIDLSGDSPALDPRQDWPEGLVADAVNSVVLDGQPHLVVGQDQTAHLVAPGPHGTLVSVGSWPAPGLGQAAIRALGADLDGDGQEELWLGLTGGRRLDRIIQGPPGAWQLQPVTGSVSHANSEVTGIVAGDLDGDGRPELAASLGPWGGYDVRLLRPGPDDSLDLVARRKLGAVKGLQAWQTPTGPELVATVSAMSPRPRDFPTSHPAGSPPGLYRFAVESGQLVDRGHTALLRGRGGRLGALFAVDLDGDGIDELAVPHGEDLWVGGFDDRGALQGVVLADVALLGVMDVDHDGEEELVVRDRTNRVAWVLGAGTQRLPKRSWAPRRQLDKLGSGWLATEGSRAEDLFAMGMAEQGAQQWVRMAELSEAPSDRAAALTRAALFHETQGRLREAEELYLRATTQGIPAPAAHRGAARCAARLHEFDKAAAHIEPISTNEAAAFRQRAAEPMWSLDLQGSLAEQTRHLDPLAVRSRPGGGGLELRALAGEVLLRVPLTRTAQRWGLELEGELHNLAWSSGISVELRATDKATEGAYLSIHGHGGGGHIETRVSGGCGFGEDWAKADSSQDHRPGVGSFRVRVDCDPTQPHGVFEVDGLGIRSISELQGSSSTDTTDFELLVRARKAGPQSPVQTRVTLTQLRVRGLSHTPSLPSALDRATEALVRGRPDEALALVGPQETGVEATDIRAVALIDQGQAERALDVLGWTTTVDERMWSKRALRLRPGLAAAVAQRHGPRAVPILWATWRRESELQPNTEEVGRAFTEGPLGTLSMQGAPPALAAEVHMARGRAWWRIGALARARQALAEADAAEGVGSDRLRKVGSDPAVARARVAVALGELPQALDLLAVALSRSAAPELLMDQLELDDALADARRDPRWPDLARIPFTPRRKAPSGAR